MPPETPAFDPGFAFRPPDAPPLDPARRYDVLVLGAGPAGIAAAIYLLRKGRSVGVVGGALGGQVAWTAAIGNYPGFRLVDGPALARAFHEQVAELAPALRLGVEAEAADRDGEGFVVAAGGERYRSRALVIATGKRPRALGVPGEERLLGRGVASCATCDAPLYRGRVVGVAGGGNSGLDAAAGLAAGSPRVLLFEAGDRLSGDAVLAGRVAALPNVEVHLGTRVVEVLGEERVRAVRTRPSAGGAEREHALAALFVEIGLDPNSGPFRGLVPLNEGGEIEVDCAGRTPVAGVFAAGDVTSVPWKQIVIAAGDGAKAGLAAHDWLLRQGASAG